MKRWLRLALLYAIWSVLFLLVWGLAFITSVVAQTYLWTTKELRRYD